MSQWLTITMLRESFAPSIHYDIGLNKMFSDMSQRFSANPVVLHGIIKDSPAVSALRKKLADDDGYVWPPRRSFKQISPKFPTTSIDRIKVLPTAVAALKIN
jgi:hypothetical protein